MIMVSSSASSNCEQVFKCVVCKVSAEGCKMSSVLAVVVVGMLPTTCGRIFLFSSGA
jgi:hypothetical protein